MVMPTCTSLKGGLKLHKRQICRLISDKIQSRLAGIRKRRLASSGVQGQGASPKKMAVSGFKKFRLLVWKNYVLQKRHAVQTAVEVVLPLVFLAVLVGVRKLINSEEYQNGWTFESWKPTDINATAIGQNLLLAANESFNTERYQVLYAPDGPEERKIMDILSQHFLDFNIDYGLITLNGTFEATPFKNETEMETAFKERADLEVVTLGGIVFNSFLNKGVNYTLRFPPKLREVLTVTLSGERWNTGMMYPIFQLLGPRSKYDKYGNLPGYHSQGFTFLQYAVDASIMKYHEPTVSISPLPGSSISGYNLNMLRYPYPAFIDDNFLVALQGWLPLIFMLSFIYPCINICKSVVVEKEKKLKESMKMMGLPNFMHWTAWFFKSLLFLTITAVLGTVLLKVHWYGNGLGVVTYVDSFILFIFLECFLFSTICLAFFLSTLFSKANSASTAAGVIWLLTFFPYFFLQPRYSELSYSSKIAPSIFHNTAMAFGCQIIAMFEGTGVGVQWNNINKGASPQDELTLLTCIGMMLFDGILYFLLAIYIEGVRPGDYGVPLPWYFPFSPTYWCGGGGTRVGTAPTKSTLGKDEEAPPQGLQAGIQIQGLSKKFGKKQAVNNLVLNMYENQITALLGHNGAGKTTTMSMLTGLIPPSAGGAIINGYDIRSDIKEVRNNLGLCPQHDVLFDEMTVEEHLQFFCELKGHPNVKGEVDRMIAAVGLEPKRHNQSQTLSGGMKRKLSVAIALVGGSKVVLLDEPTSGMDPGARRATWDLLVSEKKDRTILLSTHFMDEADLLGDRVAIMAEGELQTVGSSLFLKKRFGGGYHLVVVKKAGCNSQKITDILRKHLGQAEVEQDVGAELSYSLLDEKSHLFADMFEELESKREELKIDSYGASITTMEEVFMKVGKAAEERKHKRHHDDGVKLNVSMETLQKDGSQYQLYEKQTLNVGTALILQQLRAMIVKKALYISRNRVLLTFQTIMPVLFLVIALLMLKTMPDFADNPALQPKIDDFGDDTTTYMQCDQADKFCDIYEKLAGLRGTKIEKVSNVNEAILNSSRNDLEETNYKRIVSIQMQGKEITAMWNNQPLHGLPITLNMMTNALLRLLTDSDGLIETTNHPFPYTNVQEVENANGPGGTGFQVGFNVMFGMSFLAASFVVFLIKERESKAKHLQYVSGVNFFMFWAASFICDYINYLITSLLLLIVLAVFRVETFLEVAQIFRVLLLFLLFGWSIIPIMYILSFRFTIPASGYVRMVLVNIFAGIGTMMAVAILSVPDLELVHVANTLDWIFMLFPQYNLAYGIVTLSTNQLYHELCPKIFDLVPNLCDQNVDNICCEKNGIGYLDWKSPGIGRNLFFMLIVGAVSWIGLLIAESKVFKKANKPNEQSAKEKIASPTEDSDVSAEAARIRNTNLTQLFKTDNLILKDLHKQYGKFTAVKCLNLGVQQKECFGLLGVNGAGKTTTFKMLTGDLPPTAGDAFVYQHSITSAIKDVQKNLGYCPQFDAIIEELTGRETIRLFARLRGVKEDQIDSLVDKLGANLLFSEHMEKRCGAYSGGNKRKLSTSIALVGNPPIVFLDEPTTGMDPVARRHLWNCISKVRDAGTSIVLTSHSMEECEALCTRLAIMVNGEFKCLGSTQHLVSKFGEGYTVIAQMASKTAVTRDTFEEGHAGQQQKVKQQWERDIEPLQNFITTSFPGAKLKDVHPGYVHYHVTDKSISWGYLFRQMEVAKGQFNLEAYSVGQTTLEQVFLNFTKSQVVDD